MYERTVYQSISMDGLLGRQLNDVESKFAPDHVFYKGSMKIPLSHPRVSMIGSRAASEHGLARARDIAKFLVKNSITVVSGLARGIDTASHRTAIEHGGNTVAVLGTPLNKTYPGENIQLQNEIMNNHMAISQYPVGHATVPKDFAIRNKTMSLISDATVIVEAGESSGSLYNGWDMIRLGRPLFICRENEEYGWTKKMVGYGALMLDDPVDVLKHLPVRQ